jgi:large subunit ribosomal protein L35
LRAAVERRDAKATDEGEKKDRKRKRRREAGITVGGRTAPLPAHKNLAKRDLALCFRPLSMQKTKKSVAKRFKLTAKGKLVRRTPGFRHLLGAKSTKQKRRASRDKLVAEGHAKPLKRALPFGLR